MRYFKKFDSFINEAAFKSDHDFNIVDMLAPLFRGVNGLFNKAKLYSIQNDLDNYLEKKYNEYENKKGNTEKTDNDVKITSNKLSVADELYVNGKKPSSSSSSSSLDEKPVKSEEPLLHTPVPEPESELEQEPVEPIKQEPTQPKDVPVKEQEPVVPQNPIDINKRSQYVTSKEMAMCEEILKNAYDENDIEGIKSSIKDNMAEMKNHQSQLANLNDDMKSMVSSKRRAEQKMLKYKRNSVEYQKIKNTELENCNTEIKSIQDRIDAETEKYENAKWWVEQFQNNLVHFENKMKTNESSEIKPANWTEKDISELRKTINPYQIDEFFIRAEIITANTKSDSLKGAWQLMVTKTAKKWYWAFGDIKTLKNPSSNYTKDDKNLSLTSMTIENVYKESKRVIYPFTDLKSYKEDYYILKNINSMTLLKKILGENDTYVFFILGNIIVDKKTNNMVVEYLFDKTKHKEMILNINDTKYKFVNQDEYPILVENNGYITNNTPPILLKNTDIQTLSTNDFKKLLSDSGIMKFDDVKLSKEYIDKIKTTYIDGKK
jgi:hypothetical protein